MQNDDTVINAYVRQFENIRTALPGGALPWLDRMREKGLERFACTGFPTRKVEAWKYSDLRTLREHEFSIPLVDEQAVSIDAPPWVYGEEGVKLVFVNGCFRADVSSMTLLQSGVEIESLSRVLATHPALVEGALGRIGGLNGQPLLALNSAFLTNGFVVRIGRGVRMDRPIEIAFLGGDADRLIGYHPRNLIVLEDDSETTILEHHLGLTDQEYFANAVTEVEVGEGSTLHHFRTQAEGLEAVHVTTLHALIGRNGVYNTFSFATGAGLSRADVSVRLIGEGAHCSLNGAYLMRGGQHCDNTSRIDHEAPHTSCSEVFKGVLDEQARAVFQGKIVIHKQAQKSDGNQLSKALLLSDGAEIDAKPELEIYADDIRCSHGAAAGELDRDALFYLRSRGLSEHIAQSLLVDGFVQEAFDEISSAPVRRALSAKVSEWLSSTRRIAT